jgi:hypothetical protein
MRGKGSDPGVRGSRGFNFRKDLRTAFTYEIYNVGGVALVLQQEVADDGKRGLHDHGAVAGGVELLRDDGGGHFSKRGGG